jgi:hypothetical protein
VTSSVILYDSFGIQITTLPSWVISTANLIKGYDVKIGPANAVFAGSYKLIVKGVLNKQPSTFIDYTININLAPVFCTAVGLDSVTKSYDYSISSGDPEY